MSLASNVIINLYSILLLIVIHIYAFKQSEQIYLQHKLFIMMLRVNIIMLIVDILGRFDGNPDTFFLVFNYFGNFLVYFLNPVLPSIWLLYVHYQIFHEDSKTLRLIKPLSIIIGINAFLLVLSQFYGYFYYIDMENIYHRGPLFWLHASISIALILASFVLIIANRKIIEKKFFTSLVFFGILPLIFVFLQLKFYGTSLMLNSVALSLLIVFFNIQNHNINTDYLTGVYNRKKLETYMKEKINSSTENKTFSAILIDLNNFKSINDNFGHDIGDDALEACVTLLKSCIRSIDIIARFGGDEFYIILDVSNKDDLEATVSRINNGLKEFNEEGTKPYKLSFSMGYAVYDYHSHMTVEEFQKRIDILMYENKRDHQVKHSSVDKELESE